jgi:uncharacterized protein
VPGHAAGSLTADVTPLGPRPAVNGENSYFWDGTKAGELRIQSCSACGRLRHPATPGCRVCGSLDWGHVVASGRGRVFSYAEVHHPLRPPFEAPYVIAVIELEENVRVVSRLVGVGAATIKIGDPVALVFDAVDDELTLPLFQLADA